MRVLLTGVTGGLGPFVLDELSNRNHEVVVFSRRPKPRDFSGAKWVVGDITEYSSCLDALEGVEAVQHIAGQRWPAEHPDFEALTTEARLPMDAAIRVNILGLYNLGLASAAAGVKTFVLAGSNCALGHGFRRSGTPFKIDRLPVDESQSTSVEDSYSYSKLVGEEMLAMFTRAFGMRTYATRLASIRNPQRRALHASEVRPAETWDPWLWAWVASEDAASAQVALMERANSLPEHDVYFVNAADTLALEPTDELVSRFRPDLLEKYTQVIDHGSLISIEKLVDAAGWQPRISWRREP